MKIVIIYTYYPSWYADYNLHFFCKKEMHKNVGNPNIDYIVVINGGQYNPNIPLFPMPNLHVLSRENIGYDFGGHAAALDYLDSIGKTYDYYFFANSSVCGPILKDPSCSQHWSLKFIEKINQRVKIVSTRILCLDEKDSGGYGPKVIGFFFATDAFGLKLLREKNTVFDNHTTKHDAIVKGEYGLTHCMIENGYSIDCILNTENIDWLDPKNHIIGNPDVFMTTPVNPYDVIFHKWYCPTNNVIMNFDICREAETL